MARKRSNKRFIASAINPANKGALRKQLGAKKGKPIPVSKLRAAAKKKGKVGQRARFALTLRKINGGKRRKRKR